MQIRSTAKIPGEAKQPNNTYLFLMHIYFWRKDKEWDQHNIRHFSSWKKRSCILKMQH